jgi:hypothetical protein
LETFWPKTKLQPGVSSACAKLDTKDGTTVRLGIDPGEDAWPASEAPAAGDFTSARVDPGKGAFVRGQGTGEHPHHTGLTLSYGGHSEGGSVNVWSDWDEPPYGPGGRIVHRGFRRMLAGPVYGEVVSVLTYLDPYGEPFAPSGPYQPLDPAKRAGGYSPYDPVLYGRPLPKNQFYISTSLRFETDFSDATVVTLYLLSSLNVRLRPKLYRELRPGSRVVSHVFDMGDWKPDSSFTVGYSAVYYWVVPANAGGEWTLTVPGGKEYTLRLQQQFQSVKGTAERDGREVPVEQFRVVGDRVILAIADRDGGVRLEGRIAQESDRRPRAHRAVEGPG